MKDLLCFHRGEKADASLPLDFARDKPLSMTESLSGGFGDFFSDLSVHNLRGTPCCTLIDNKMPRALLVASKTPMWYLCEGLTAGSCFGTGPDV